MSSTEARQHVKRAYRAATEEEQMSYLEMAQVEALVTIAESLEKIAARGVTTFNGGEV